MNQDWKDPENSVTGIAPVREEDVIDLNAIEKDQPHWLSKATKPPAPPEPPAPTP